MFRYLAHLERVVLIRRPADRHRGPRVDGGGCDRCGTGSRSRFTQASRVQNGHVTQERPATARSEESHEA